MLNKQSYILISTLTLYIYIYIYFVGRAGIHPTKIPKSVVRPLSKYLKYSYPYLSIYILTGGRAGEQVGRICRAGWNPRVFAHPYVLPKPPFPIQRWLLMKKKRRESRNIQRLEIGERRWFRKFRFFFLVIDTILGQLGEDVSGRNQLKIVTCPPQTTTISNIQIPNLFSKTYSTSFQSTIQYQKDLPHSKINIHSQIP